MEPQIISDKCPSPHRLSLQDGSVIPLLFNLHLFFYSLPELYRDFQLVTCSLLGPSSFKPFVSHCQRCHSPEINSGSIALAMLPICPEISGSSLRCTAVEPASQCTGYDSLIHLFQVHFLLLCCLFCGPFNEPIQYSWYFPPHSAWSVLTLH